MLGSIVPQNLACARSRTPGASVLLLTWKRLKESLALPISDQESWLAIVPARFSLGGVCVMDDHGQARRIIAS
jgi:hypothetical protein